MSEYACYLLTLTTGVSLYRVAVVVDPEDLGPDVWEYWAEPENNAAIWRSLPGHVRALGVVVEVRNIFEVVDQTESRERPACRVPGMEVPPPPQGSNPAWDTHI